MNKWLIGARVKTLPAAVAPVLVGTSLSNQINLTNAFLALLVSLSLQIAVNYANDHSDGVRGTDSDRVGPIRLVASGLATAAAVRNAAIIFFCIAACCGLVLAISTSLWLVLVGMISILAAWGYTGGNKPYGYFGFGELSVFTFFGLVATMGSYYVQSKELTSRSLLLSLPMGCLACAILVINNLRDIDGDKLANKQTLAVKLGQTNTRRFYVLLLVFAQLFSFLAISTSVYAIATLLLVPLTYSCAKQVLKGAIGLDLVGILSKSAKLQLATSIILSIVLRINC